MDRDDPRCSFCGKAKTEVRKLIERRTPEPSADVRVLPPVSICDQCAVLCAEACSGGMNEIEGELHRTLELLVRAAIDALHTPPPGYDEMPQNLKWLVTPLLGAVREALMELEADQPYLAGKAETSEEALREAVRRAWELIDECRTVRAGTRAPGP